MTAPARDLPTPVKGPEEDAPPPSMRLRELVFGAACAAAVRAAAR
ncbi:methyltransferase, partial [Streptomyces hyaluromycini]